MCHRAQSHQDETKALSACSVSNAIALTNFILLNACKLHAFIQSFVHSLKLYLFNPTIYSESEKYEENKNKIKTHERYCKI